MIYNLKINYVAFLIRNEKTMDIQTFLKAQKIYNQLEEINKMKSILKEGRKIFTNNDAGLMGWIHTDASKATESIKEYISQVGLDEIDHHLEQRYQIYEDQFVEL